jgi:Ni,Fe-hydrogenase III component G
MSEARRRYEAAFGTGFAPEAGQAGSLAVLRADEEALARMVRHWDALSPAELPCLHGLTTSPGDSSRAVLNLLFDLGEGASLVCVEADFPRDRTFPDLSRLWPHAAWWQDELAVFSGIRFEGSRQEGGVRWRLA